MSDIVDFMLLFLGLDTRDFSSRAATDAGGCSSRCVINCLKSTLFSTKLCLGMVLVAEIRNDISFAFQHVAGT